MPKINIEIPTDLHDRLKSHPFMSISKLCKLGIEMALHRYPPALLDPRLALEQITGPMNPTSNPVEPRSTPLTAAPAPDAPPAKLKPKTLDPIGESLKPWVDPRTKLTWFDVSGFLTYTGLARADLEAILDPAEDLDRSGDDREILDTAAMNRLLDNVPGKSWPNLDRYHALVAWLEARQ